MASEAVTRWDDLRCRAAREMDESASSAVAKSGRKPTQPAELATSVHEIGPQQLALERLNDDLEVAQAALIETRHHFARLFELAPVGYLCLDPEALIREVNAAGAALVGLAASHMVGRTMSSFLAPDCHATFREHRRAALDSKTVERCELVLIGAGNRRVPVTAMSLAEPHVGHDLDGYRMVLIESDERLSAAECLRAKDELIAQRDAELEQHRLAVHALAEQLVYERTRVGEAVRANVEQVLMPIVLKLREHVRWDECAAFDALERGLRELGSGFAKKLAGSGFSLTGRELEICHLLREGRSSKEIAQVLSISPQSVDVHRRNIRKKLGLTHQSQSLLDKLREIDLDPGTQSG